MIWIGLPFLLGLQGVPGTVPSILLTIMILGIQFYDTDTKVVFPEVRMGATILLGSYGYLGFGLDGIDVINDFFRYNPNLNSWSCLYFLQVEDVMQLLL